MFQLRKLREMRNIQQKELAIDMGVSQPTISDWELGRKIPSAKNTEKLADYFGVSVDYIMGRTQETPAGPEGLKIPVLGSVPAGVPLEAIEDIVDWEELSPELTKGGREYFALKVKGDSMYPDYLDGDTVIVRKTPTCDSGDVCVVYVNGYDATLKQVKFSDGGRMTLLPRNPEYPPRTFTAEEVAELPVSIAGVVVELRRRIK